MPLRADGCVTLTKRNSGDAIGAGDDDDLDYRNKIK